MTLDELLSADRIVCGLRAAGKAALLEDLARRTGIALGRDVARSAWPRRRARDSAPPASATASPGSRRASTVWNALRAPGSPARPPGLRGDRRASRRPRRAPAADEPAPHHGDGAGPHRPVAARTGRGGSPAYRPRCVGPARRPGPGGRRLREPRASWSAGRPFVQIRSSMRSVAIRTAFGRCAVASTA